MYHSYEDYKKSQESLKNPFYSIINQLQPLQVIGLFVLFFLANSIVKRNPQSNWIYIVVAVAGVLYLFSLMNKDMFKKKIPRHIGLRIAHDDLKSEIGLGKTFPVGTEINPTIIFKDNIIKAGPENVIEKYNFGFSVIEPGKSERQVIYQQDPFTGLSEGIIDAPIEGFTGENIKDYITLIPEEIKITDTKKEP